MKDLHVDKLLTILGMASVTYLTRAACMTTLGTWPVPAGVERALRYVPVGVLTSLVIPQVLLLQGRWVVGSDSSAVWGALATGLVAARRASPLVAMAAGMLVVALARALGAR